MARVSKKQLVTQIFAPNAEGLSQWITRQQLEGTGLALGKNGNSRHGVFFSDNRYVWEKQTEKSMVVALRTIGLSEGELYGANRPIRKDIRDFHLPQGCVVCGCKSSLVVDHKNDLYNDPRVLNAQTQTADDFQCLCNSCNLQKRQVAKLTRETGIRYGATNIPSMALWGMNFTSGNETFDVNDPNAMVGTYWYDVKAFHAYIISRVTPK